MEHIFAVNRCSYKAANRWVHAQVRVRKDGYGCDNPWIGLVQSAHMHETRHKYFIKRHDYYKISIILDT